MKWPKESREREQEGREGSEQLGSQETTTSDDEGLLVGVCVFPLLTEGVLHDTTLRAPENTLTGRRGLSSEFS